MGRLGVAGQFWFGGGVGPLFSLLDQVWSMVLSRRGGSSSDHHVGQAKERMEVMPVLGQSSIPHFPMPENILHDVERMFHKRSPGGFGFLDGLERFFLRASRQGLDRAAFARDLPVYLPFQGHDLGSLSPPRCNRRRRGPASPARAIAPMSS